MISVYYGFTSNKPVLHPYLSMPMLIRVLKLEKYSFKIHLERIQMCDLVAIIHKLTHDNHHVINRD